MGEIELHLVEGWEDAVDAVIQRELDRRGIPLETEETCEHCGKPVQAGRPHTRRWGVCWALLPTAEEKVSLQTPEGQRDLALNLMTLATRDVNEARRDLFDAQRRQSTRRKQALAAGATYEEIRAAMNAAPQPEVEG